MKQSTDPLEGYKPRTEVDEANEAFVRDIHAYADRGIDYASMADIRASQNLIDALKEDTVLAKLVTHCANVIQSHSYEWTCSNEPDTLKGKHLEARAARLVIAWVEAIETDGYVAEQLIKQQDTNHE